jgi:hypothetical protein
LRDHDRGRFDRHSYADSDWHSGADWHSGSAVYDSGGDRAGFGGTLPAEASVEIVSGCGKLLNEPGLLYFSILSGIKICRLAYWR